MLRRVMSTEFDLDEAEIQRESHLVDDLDLDSIDGIDLAVKVEEITGVAVKEEELQELLTVRDIISLIDGRLNGTAGG